jgi:hypothetical protein
MRARIFQVWFLGESVPCDCYEHARALQTAEEILVGSDSSRYRPEQLDQLATILDLYACREAASALRERATLLLQGS